jgi:hypothetical protein
MNQLFQLRKTRIPFMTSLRAAMLCLSGVLALLFFVKAPPAYAQQVTLVPPFVGTHSETWEEFPIEKLESNVISILGGTATISGILLEIDGPHMFLECYGYAAPSDGVRFLGANARPTSITISFSQPVSAFGAYWGALPFSCQGNPTELSFHNASGNLIGTASFDYSPPRTPILDMDWHGYAFATPVKTITIVGDWVVTDGMQVTVASSGTSPISNPATNVASFSATLNGSLNPNGSITSVRFQYGPTTSYGFTTPVQTQTGNTVRNISANIIGLSAGHIYHFRIVASNSGGTHFGSDRTFTTLSATGAPVVTTNPATTVASFSAMLNGSLDPHGLTTSVSFQYGTTTSYGSTNTNQAKSGNTYQSVAANISGLTASTTYHFRIVATNSAGTRYGSDRTFTTLSATGPPVVTTSPATFIASFSATLNGLLDPHGLTTSVHFQYGPTTSYGLTAAAPSQTGNTFRNVSANISSLSANHIYHYRIVATNSAGPSLGSDSTFTTLTATGPPVVTTSPATNVASSSAMLHGSLDPHGLTTSVSFQYGKTTNYGSTTPMQSQTGSTFRTVSANISGLSAHTIYHFRITVTNNAGNRLGSNRTFTTP